MYEEIRFWLDAGVGGLRLDAITTLSHDPELRDNPACELDPNDPEYNAKARNPFYWQRMIFSRDQPRTLEVLGELRALVDQYSERYLIGEVLDVDMIAVSSKYTRTGKHLHNCYTFELMQQRFDASVLRRAIELTEESLGTGWTSWAMSNHDNIRVVSRFGSSEHLAGDDRALAQVLLAALLTIRGGACVYQGEELGLTEAEIDGFETYSVLVNPNNHLVKRVLITTVESGDYFFFAMSPKESVTAFDPKLGRKSWLD